jgi:hypothetical protein
MVRLQSLATKGARPKRLATCVKPICAGCLYGKMARTQWRSKGENKKIAANVKHAGECVSVDHLISGICSLIERSSNKRTT